MGWSSHVLICSCVCPFGEMSRVVPLSPCSLLWLGLIRRRPTHALLGHETHVCNISLLGAYWINTLSCWVMLWCHVVSTHIVHVMRTCNVYCYVWDPTPSSLFLVASLMGKCFLMLPLSHSCLLLLWNTWDDRHVSLFAPVSVPSSKCLVLFL